MRWLALLMMLEVMIWLTIFLNVSNAVILTLLLLCQLCLYVLDLNSGGAALGSHAVLLVLSLKLRWIFQVLSIIMIMLCAVIVHCEAILTELITLLSLLNFGSRRLP